MLEVRRLSGDDLRAHLDDLARLRIEVFRAWPYLYQGTMDFERNYLPLYGKVRTGTLIAALDGDKVMGAATGLGLDEEEDYVQAPFVKAGMDVSRIFYFAESVLLPQYRGQGVGVRFFEEREAAARSYGYAQACFCAVMRPDNHPARPKDYVTLDEFWTHRGYVRRPDLVSTFSWVDVGDTEETEKSMVYWMKTL